MLELAVEADVDLVTAAKIALGSMMSTARANLWGRPTTSASTSTTPARSASSASSATHPCPTSSARSGERQLLDGIAQLPPISQEDVTEARTRS